ncbi:MAG TPA: hypothetical protein VGO67_26005 [Verrucomicrobiae bacterium]|jgi:hypothetical protein
MNKYCACIESQLEKEHHHGFHTIQVIDYQEKESSERECRRSVPGEKARSNLSAPDAGDW